MKNPETTTPDSGMQATQSTPPARRRPSATTVLAILLAFSLVCNILLGISRGRLKAHAEEMDDTYSESYFYFDSLTVDSFREKVAAGDAFIVLITRPNCSNCVRLERPFIDFAQQRGITDSIYLLNVVQLRRDEEAWVAFKDTYGFKGTPTYARFEGGRQLSNIGWTPEDGIELDMVEAWFAAQEDFFTA